IVCLCVLAGAGVAGVAGVATGSVDRWCERALAAAARTRTPAQLVRLAAVDDRKVAAVAVAELRRRGPAGLAAVLSGFGRALEAGRAARATGHDPGPG